MTTAIKHRKEWAAISNISHETFFDGTKFEYRAIRARYLLRIESRAAYRAPSRAQPIAHRVARSLLRIESRASSLCPVARTPVRIVSRAEDVRVNYCSWNNNPVSRGTISVNRLTFFRGIICPFDWIKNCISLVTDSPSSAREGINTLGERRTSQSRFNLQRVQIVLVILWWNYPGLYPVFLDCYSNCTDATAWSTLTSGQLDLSSYFTFDKYCSNFK
ncbi:uncharacterized protein LOC143182074 [Calliopsis andreniformis]|uniref:uncharacterized protein LOC143182074 n=1 Tax=Calliopsis andreniformis TaxID=337506 RepID=UPI003FCC4F60